ncbi:M20/M25/M40 family metallo-hydrolase [Desulfospira joergensenii]|uniref:M20/M25/M40 family metallo-hydrolase n=1 Tax=Desulfospira joergensenii TaxID=53329 RepID=UPI0003B4C8D7|nr:M20/M25/M40 family metallo-hydrolase [Desulfospira joergensenii]
MINSKRLGQTFTKLAQIDSISRHEAGIARELEQILKSLGASICFDDAGEKVGGDCSNLVAKFKGNRKVPPMFLSGHMDTVEPGNGVKVVFEEGVFRSDGTTILGADDKSALAIILEVLEVIKENDLPSPPLEIIFTVCEEIGLMGAKHFDHSLMDSKFGYILDSTDTEGIVTKAPAANKISATVYGRAAHAGASPEKGVSAIFAASRAIAGMTLGRIDPETTCNLGTICGGMATNIVPEQVEIHGEARSHSPSMLERVTRDIVNGFEDAARELRGDDEFPRVEVRVENDFPNTDIPEDHIAVKLARKASANLGRDLESKTTGGGADANIFFGKGIVAGVLGTGMTDVHTLQESIRLEDMVNSANLILEIIKLHASGVSLG